VGDVHWLRDLPDDAYAIDDVLDPPAVIIEDRWFARLGEYSGTLPTGPSPGRVFRRNDAENRQIAQRRFNRVAKARNDVAVDPDDWLVCVIEQDADPDYVLWRWRRAIVVDAEPMPVVAGG
jgi:hypothetical protein